MTPPTPLHANRNAEDPGFDPDRQSSRSVRMAPTPKQPPHSLEAEQSVLGGLLVNNRAWLNIADALAEDDFYTQDHRTIFRAIGELLNANGPCDFVTLSEHLRSKGELDEAGGISYLGTLAADTPGAANIRAYAAIVRERSVLRSLIATGQDIAELGYEPDGRSHVELLEHADKKLHELRNRGARGDNQAELYASLIPRLEDQIEAARASGEVPGQSTGLHDLDALTTGMHPGDLIIVGGRPGMGKTAFAMNIAEHVSIDCRKPVLVFSMEMPRDQLSKRSVAARGRIDSQHLRTGQLDDADWAALANVGALLRAAPLAIDDTGALSPNELRARARRHQARHGLSLIVVDYLQLMQVPSTRGNRENEVSECSRSLKALAKELGCPVIALSQLSRGVEARDEKRPRMSDMRESGAIEQDADLVLLLYRDDYYHKDSPHCGVAEIIVGKQRNGPPGSCDARFEPEYSRFSNWTGPARAQRYAAAKAEQEAQQAGQPRVGGFRARKPRAAAPATDDAP